MKDKEQQPFSMVVNKKNGTIVYQDFKVDQDLSKNNRIYSDINTPSAESSIMANRYDNHSQGNFITINDNSLEDNNKKRAS